MSFLQNPSNRGPLMNPAGLITGGVGAIGSVISGLLGSRAANKAGQLIYDTGNRVGDNITKAGADAVTGVDNAVGAGQNWISNAQQDVTGSVANAQNAMGAGKAQAQNYLDQIFGAQASALAPYMQTGAQGNATLQEMMAPGGFLTQQFKAPSAEDVENTPGYQFQLQQGQKALMRGGAAAGQVGSGGTAKALDQYTQGLASTYYQNAYNNALGTFQTNRNNTMSALGMELNQGQFGTSQFDAAAQNYGNTSSANNMMAAQYIGNAGMQGSEFNAGLSQYAAQLGLSGAQLAGMFGLNSAEGAGNAYMGGAQGQAAGTMGSANSWMNAINGISGAVGYGGRMGAFGGGGGGYGGYGTYSPTTGNFNYNPYNPYGAPRV